jgi:hypothetical protein
VAHSTVARVLLIMAPSHAPHGIVGVAFEGRLAAEEKKVSWRMSRMETMRGD